MFKILYTLTFFLLLSPDLYAYGDHESWSSSRGSYSLPYLFTTQTEAIHSDVTTTNPETEESSKVNYRGFGLKTALGTEIAKFARFSAYHLYRDLANSPSDSFRGTEFGGEIKLNFHGPVINVQFGFGLFGSRQTVQNLEGGSVYYGQGYVGSIGFERFLGNRASFLFTLKGQGEAYEPEGTTNKNTLEAQTIGAAAALILWLQ